MSRWLEDLGHDVNRARPTDESQRIARQRARLMSDPRCANSPSGTWRLWPAVAALAVGTATAAVLVVQLGQGTAIEAELRGGGSIVAGQWLEAAQSSQVIEFNEGSSVALEAGTRARITQLRSTQVEFVLESGRVRSAIRKGRAWRFRAGPYQVHVIGTQFSVDWRPGAARLITAVETGSVRVSGGRIGSTGMLVERDQRLRADSRGVRLEVAGASAPTPATDAAPPRPDMAIDLRGSTMARPARVRPQPSELSQDWRELAERESYRAALRAAKQAGLDRILRHASAKELMLLADCARYASQPKVAKRALSAIRDRFAKTPLAVSAAFRLGRLEFDQRQDYLAAARWFRLVLKEAPAGDALAADAHGRLMVAVQRQGLKEAAQDIAREYLRKYPQGPYAPSARALLASPKSGD